MCVLNVSFLSTLIPSSFCSLLSTTGIRVHMVRKNQERKYALSVVRKSHEMSGNFVET